MVNKSHILVSKPSGETKMKDLENSNDKLNLEAEVEDTKDVYSTSGKKPTYVDVKDGDSDVFFDPEEYVYLSDGVYVHKDECWF
jgi:hypothetical protein